MLHHNDLYRYCQPGDTAFDDKQIEQIIYRADLHLVQRGSSGCYIIPLLYFIAGYASSFSTDYTTAFYIGAIAMLAASLGRIHSGLKLKTAVLPSRLLWQRYYYFSCLLTGLCWGVYAAASLCFYAASWENVLVLVMVAGIVGGSISSYSNWLSLNRVYLLFLMGPIILVSFLFPEKHILVAGVLFAISFLYNLGQAKIQSSIYWNSLINIYLLKNEAAAHQKSQAALRQERDMFMNGPVMTFSWKNGDNWPVRHVSENVLDILGYTAEQFLDGSVQYADIIHPDDLKRVNKEVASGSNREENFFTHEPYRLKTRTGGIVWVLATTTLSKDSDNELSLFQAYLVDVTKTIHMEEEVVETKDRLQAITQNVPGVIFQFYISDTGESGVRYTSPKLLDIFDLESIDDPPRMLQTFVENIHADDQSSWMDSVQKAVEERIPWKWQGRYVKPSGKIIWFEGRSSLTVHQDETV